jgi:hypothetical protein
MISHFEYFFICFDRLELLIGCSSKFCTVENYFCCILCLY